MKQKYVTEFLHVEKLAPLAFINTCAIVMENTEIMVECFSSGDSGHGSPPLSQFFRSIICRFLSISYENTQLNYVDNVEKQCFIADNFVLSYRQNKRAIVPFVSVVVSVDKNRRHYFWSKLCSFISELSVSSPKISIKIQSS